MSPTASSTPLPSPTPLVPWRPRATVAPDSNKLKHSRGTKKISAPLASTPACPASGRQNLHNLLATNHAQPPLTRPPPRQPQWVRHPPASARAPAPASCLPSRNESPSLLFLPLLVSSRLVASLCVLCLPVCSCLLSFPSLSFAWAFLPPEERCSLPRLRVRPTVRSSLRRIPAVGFERNSIFLSQLASLAIGRPSPRHVHRTAVGSAARVASWYPAVALAEVPYSSAKALAPSINLINPPSILPPRCTQ